MWWPCDACGGAALPLRRRAGIGASGSTALPLMPRAAPQPCPGCETRRKRFEPPGTGPTVWYDALLGDWVLRLPCPGLPGGALVPLEIRWFDAPGAEVYRAASDLAYAGDAFEDLASGEAPAVERNRQLDGSS